MSSLDITNEEKHKHKRQISNETFYTNTPYLQSNGSRLKFINNSNRKKTDFTKFQKNTVIAQRVMSAKAQRLKQMHNELQELRCQVHELFNENRLLKNIQKRQDAALAKYEDNASALPKLLENHHAEVSALRAHSKTLRTTIRDLEHRLNRSDTELMTLREQYSKLKKLADDKELSSRSDLQRKSEDLEQRLREMDDKNSLLNRKFELEQKKHCQQMKNEIAKRRLVEDDLNLTRIEIHRLKELLEDSGKSMLNDSTKVILTPTNLQNNISSRKKSAHNLLLSTNSVIQDNKSTLSKYASLPHIVKNKTNIKEKLQSITKIPEIGQLQYKKNRNLTANSDRIEHNKSVKSNNQSFEDISNIDLVNKSQKQIDNLIVEENVGTERLKCINRSTLKNLDSLQIEEKSNHEDPYQLSQNSSSIEICETDFKALNNRSNLVEDELKKMSESSINTAENSDTDSNKSSKKNISIAISSVSSESTSRLNSNIKLKSHIKKQISFESKYGKQKNRASSNVSSESRISSSTIENNVEKNMSDNDKSTKVGNELFMEKSDIQRDLDSLNISPKLEAITNLDENYDCKKNFSIFSIEDSFKFTCKGTNSRPDNQMNVNFSREIGDLQKICVKNENRNLEKHISESTDVIENKDISSINKKIEQGISLFDIEFDKYHTDIMEDVNISNMATDKHTQEFQKATYESEILKSSLQKNEIITKQLKNNRMDSGKKNKLLAALRAIDDGNDVSTSNENFLMQRTERKSFLNELLHD